MKINILKILYYMGFVLIFFPCFVIYFVPNTPACISVGLIFWIVTYFFCFIYNSKKFLRFMKKLFHNKIYKSYFIFMLYILLTTVTHIFLGYYTANASHYIAKARGFIIQTFIMFLFPTLSIYLNIKLRNIIKIFLSTLYIIVLLGIIQYIGLVTRLSFIQYILDIFSNARFFIHFYDFNGAFEHLRIFSVYSEPNDLAIILFITMPFALYIYGYKKALFKNELVDIIIKKTFILNMLLDIILTKSPIYLILSLLEFIILLIINIRKHIKKKLVSISITLIVFICTFPILYQNDYIKESSQYQRIATTLDSITSFDKLTKNSASLACRIVSYRVHIEIWKQNLIFGVGFGNEGAYANDLFYKIEIPLTYENIQTYYLHPKVWGLNGSMVWSTLSNFGIVGFILLINLYCQFFKYSKFLVKNSFGIEKIFNYSLLQSLIMTCIIAFYNLGLSSFILWLIFGLIFTSSLQYNENYKKFRQIK